MALDSTTALSLAREAYQASTSYFDASIRKQVEGDIRQFQGQHPNGSKYHSEAYRSRSRLFRPKTRSAVRKHEAIAAEAFFSTRDVLNVEAQDQSNDLQVAGADLMREIVQYRLSKTIPWFLTLMGAYQDAQTVGLVCSYQHWVFDKKKGKDQPAVDLIAIENIRFDPGADWMDPVNTSPYFIQMIPMYVKDVRARMKAADDKTGEAKWKTLEESSLLKAVRGYSDSTRLTREQGRTDSKENASNVTAYSIVWVHKNIVEHDGVDYCYYTLGDQELLSDPKPLTDQYWHGKRPYVVGYCVIETHKNYPAGPVRLTKDVQAEINDLANLRQDNLRLVLNKRYLVARGRQVDLRSLTKNVAGSVTLVNDIEKDVKELSFTDSTASSFREQENLNLDFDEASGNFSQSSVQSNRRMNETVGGLTLLTTDANQVSGYQLRTFVETWVEPVLRQLVLLEQHYETDEVVLALAGQRADIFQRFGADVSLDSMLNNELTLTVSVGMGATNPQEKVNRFLTAIRALKEILAGGELQQYGLKVQEVAKEIFGNLGYRDGSRFMDMSMEDPRLAELTSQVQQLQAALDAKNPPEVVAAQVDKIRAEIDKIKADTVKSGVDTTFSATQAAQTIAQIPEVAPMADVVMSTAGWQAPSPAGDDPNLPQPAGASGMPTTEAAILTPPGHPQKVQADQVSGGAPGDTSPNTPATAGTGAEKGIETQRSDSVRGMANGGLVIGNSTTYGLDNLDPQAQSVVRDVLTAFPNGASGTVRNVSFPDPTPAPRRSAIDGPGTVTSDVRALSGALEQSVDGTVPKALSAREDALSAAIDGPGTVADALRHPLTRYADGGQITGPGTGTSDSIPAVNTDTGQPLAVSNGEFKIPPEVVQALGKDFFDELIAQYHTPIEGQPAIYHAAAPFDTALGMQTGTIIIPADVVQALGADFFDELVSQYGAVQ